MKWATTSKRTYSYRKRPASSVPWRYYSNIGALTSGLGRRRRNVRFTLGRPRTNRTTSKPLRYVPRWGKKKPRSFWFRGPGATASPGLRRRYGRIWRLTKW